MNNNTVDQAQPICSIQLEKDSFGFVVDAKVTSALPLSVKDYDDLMTGLRFKQMELVKQEAVKDIELDKVYYINRGGSSLYFLINKIEDGEVYGFQAERNRLSDSYHVRNQEIHIVDPSRLKLVANQPNLKVGLEEVKSYPKLRM